MVSEPNYVVAYLVNQYPKVSHSFIRREIRAIEDNGFEVLRLALRGCDEDLVDAEDIEELGRTRYVLNHGAVGLVVATCAMFFRSPVKFIRALGLAIRISRRADRPLPIHLIYLAEACVVLPWLRQARVRHLHAHFGTNATEVALLVHTLGGPTYSFTVHGPVEFDGAFGLHLDEKVRDSSFVVAISSFCSSQIRRWVGTRQWDKIRIVRCGVDAAFLQDASAAGPSGPQLVCVGRLCEQKGQLLLVEAAAELARRGQDFSLVLAGDGEMRAQVEAKIREHGLEAKVRITGWLSSEGIREEILASRAMVLPSFAEGLPVVIMESMALGRPVLSTYVAGIPELVRPGETGWLVPAGSVEQLADALQVVLRMPDAELDAMGQRGKRRVASQHSVAAEAGNLAREFRIAIEDPVRS